MKFALAMMCLVAGQMVAQDSPQVPQRIQLVPGQGLAATYGFPQTVPGDAPRVLVLQTIDPEAARMRFQQGLAPTYGFPQSIPGDAPARWIPAQLISAGVRLEPQISANYILRDASTVTASGQVDMRTRTMVVRADRAVLDTKTGEIEASRNVRISPVAPGQR